MPTNPPPPTTLTGDILNQCIAYVAAQIAASDSKSGSNICRVLHLAYSAGLNPKDLRHRRWRPVRSGLVASAKAVGFVAGNRPSTIIGLRLQNLAARIVADTDRNWVALELLDLIRLNPTW